METKKHTGHFYVKIDLSWAHSREITLLAMTKVVASGTRLMSTVTTPNLLHRASTGLPLRMASVCFVASAKLIADAAVAQASGQNVGFRRRNPRQKCMLPNRRLDTFMLDR